MQAADVQRATALSLLFGSPTRLARLKRFSFVALRRHLSVVLPVFGGAQPVPERAPQQAVRGSIFETIETGFGLPGCDEKEENIFLAISNA